MADITQKVNDDNNLRTEGVATSELNVFFVSTYKHDYFLQ
jgi:hypothetical protein